MEGGIGPAQAPPPSRAALNVGPRAPPAQLAAAISAVSEQLRCGLGGPALRPVSSLGSLCHGYGLGIGRAGSGRVTERWKARLSRPQFPLMGGPAPRYSKLLEVGGQDSRCSTEPEASTAPTGPVVPKPCVSHSAPESRHSRKSPCETALRMGQRVGEAAPSRPISPDPLHRAMQDLIPRARGGSAHPGAV